MILASGSPRRRELLAELGIDALVRPARVNETPLEGESPVALVARLARDKAQATYETLSDGERADVVLAADTVVWADGEILGKPPSVEDAEMMLRFLSGRTHQVSTGVCFLAGGKTAERTPRMCSFVETTEVEFYELTDEQIHAYALSREPADKAGAYGIQGTGRLLVKRINGDYFNVVGLPVARVLRELDRMMDTQSNLLQALA